MDKKELMNTAWKGFREGAWMDGINVRNFIQKNYTLYEGDDAFLAGISPKTKAVWGKCSDLIVEEIQKGIIDVETEERYEFGPFPESLYFISQTIAITDQGLMFLSNSNGGQIAINTTGDIIVPEAPAGFQFQPEVQGSSADGRYWVGFAKESNGEEGLTWPLLWTDGVAEKLPMPAKNFRTKRSGTVSWHGASRPTARSSTVRHGKTSISAWSTGNATEANGKWITSDRTSTKSNLSRCSTPSGRRWTTTSPTASSAPPNIRR